MPTAMGPPCVACGQKQAKLCIPHCQFCKQVLCWRCTCPPPWTVPHGPNQRMRDVIHQKRDEGRKRRAKPGVGQVPQFR